VTNITATDEIQRRLSDGERDFQGATLSGANLRGANLRGVNLRGANLRGASLHGADLREAKLMRTDLGMADVGMADFTGADVGGADLRGANLKGARFGGAVLNGANLRGADLNGADLRASKLVRADLSRADLRVADIGQADLRGVDLRGADLTGANLKDASLLSATLHGADLRGANLTGANLRGANLTDTRLEAAILTNAAVGATVFADLDLRQATGLETLRHGLPSTVGIDTLTRSQGAIPDTFLRGCGLARWEILSAKQYDGSLSEAAMEALQKEIREARHDSRPPMKRILISHSAVDQPFVEELKRCLLEKDIFAWVTAHDAKSEVRERQSKLAIHYDVTLLLVLSQSSVQSEWVEHEVRIARKLENSLGEIVLRPVCMDDSWKSMPWQARISEKVGEDGVLSFANWSENDAMKAQFGKLLEAIAQGPVDAAKPQVPTEAGSGTSASAPAQAV
jgi:uncharacterized protein YjbI with pentapeptide repeats